MNRKPTLASVSCAILLSASAAMQVWPQSAADTQPKPMTRAEMMEHFERDGVDTTYLLHYATSPVEQNEILTALRNMVDPQTKIFLLPSSGIIAVHAPIEVQERVVKLLAALDKPESRYRLTYTVTELDGTKKIGVQHFSMVVLNGQRSQMKQGSRQPLLTSAGKPDNPASAYQYVDVGMSFDATLVSVQGGAVLKNKVEQSSIAPDSISPSNPNPVIRQTLLEGTTSLVNGKPLLLGSLDVPSSTRHFDVEVQMDPVN